MPSLPDFRTKITIERQQDQKADLSIKVKGFCAGGSKTFSCTVSQSQTISAIPVNLVIQASVKIVRFEDKEGDFFYICYPVNISRNVVAKKTKNLFEVEGGYEKLIKLPGVVDRYDTTVLAEPQPVTETLKESTKINMAVDIGAALNLPTSLEISGEVTVRSTLQVSYTLPIGYEYAAHVQNEHHFSHVWAAKS